MDGHITLCGSRNGDPLAPQAGENKATLWQTVRVAPAAGIESGLLHPSRAAARLQYDNVRKVMVKPERKR